MKKVEYISTQGHDSLTSFSHKCGERLPLNKGIFSQFKLCQDFDSSITCRMCKDYGCVDAVRASGVEGFADAG